MQYSYLFFCAVGLCGCAGINTGSVTSDIKLKNVVNRIECDISSAYHVLSVDYKWLKDWAVGYTITISKDYKNGLSGNLDYSVPLPTNAGFSLSASAGLSGQNVRKLDFKRFLEFRNLGKLECPVASEGILTEPLGLLEPLRDALDAVDSTDKSKAKPETLSYRIDLILSGNASVAPGFKLYRVPAADIKLYHEYIATYTLDFAIVDISPEQPPPQQVYVVNFPGQVVGMPGSRNVKSIGAVKSTAVPDRKRPGPSRIDDSVKRRLDGALQRLRNENPLSR